MTYHIAAGELLLRGHDATLSLRGVKRGIASDDSLAGLRAGRARLGPDLGDGFPVVRHCFLFTSGALWLNGME